MWTASCRRATSGGRPWQATPWSMAVAGLRRDRRKTLLIGTEKARSVVERGREVQNRFLERLLDHTDEAQRAAFFATLETMSKNLDAIIEGED